MKKTKLTIHEENELYRKFIDKFTCNRGEVNQHHPDPIFNWFISELTEKERIIITAEK